MAKVNNSNDLRDVMLEVVAGVQETMRELEQEIVEPQIMEAVVEAWTLQSAEVKEKVKRERPEAYAAMMELLK